MATRPIKRFIDVEITKDTPSVSAAGFGILMTITNSELLSIARRARSFTTEASVKEFFGEDSEEGKYANAYFNQDPFNVFQPEELIFGRFVNAVSPALLECGSSPLTDIDTWKSITDGSLTVEIDGVDVDLTDLDFSLVTSLDDVATVIDTALGINGTCYYLINRFNFESATTGVASTISLLTPEGTGTDISGTGFLDGDVAYSAVELGGSYLSQGSDIETASTAIDAIQSANGNWYAMGGLKFLRDSDETEDMADAIESMRKMFLIATNDTNVLISGSTDTICYYLKDNNYKRTAIIHDDNPNLYPDASWLGLELPKEVGSTNWSFKTLPGIAEGADFDIDPVSLSSSQIDAALSVNCNVYTETLGASFVYFGTMGGGKNTDKEGEYIDVIRNIDFLQARVEEGLISLLLEVDILYMTDGGISTTDNRLKSLLDVYGVKQRILIDGSVTTSFPKRSDISAANRDDRKLPGGTFNGELTGGIDNITVRGTVSI